MKETMSEGGGGGGGGVQRRGGGGEGGFKIKKSITDSRE